MKREAWYAWVVRRRWPLAVAGALLRGVWLSAPLLRTPHFTGPDMPVILPPLSQASLGQVLGWFGSDWVQRNNFFRPLTSLSFWVDYQLFGLQPLGWRVHNLLLVLLCAWLLGELARRMARSDLAGLVTMLAATAGAPQGAIIDYVAPRTDALCAVCYLLCLLLAWEGARRRDSRLLVGSLLAALLALLAKEMAISLAVMLPLTYALGGLTARRWAGWSAAAVALHVGFWLWRAAALGQHPLRPKLPDKTYSLASMLDPYWFLLFPPYGSWAFYHALEPVQLLLGFTWLWIGRDVLHVLILLALARWAWPLLLFALAWKACSYPPAMHSRLIGTHYYYIPQMGNALLLGFGLAVLGDRLWRWWQERTDG